MSSWLYRKPVTISRASGTVSDYQMKILVGESAGSGTHDVNCAGKCKNDFSDLRFTSYNGTTTLDYWIESLSGASPNQVATVWVEISSVPVYNRTIYMYYGNAGAAAVTNGDATFLFFDDFNAALDSDKWDTTQGEILTSGGYLEVIGTTGTRGKIIQNTANYPAIPIGAASRVKAYCNATIQTSQHFMGGMWEEGGITDDSILFNGTNILNRISNSTYNETVATQSYNDISALTSSHIYDTTWVSDSVKWWQGADNYRENTTNIPDADLSAVFYEGNTAGPIAYVDWVCIRKFETTGPAFGTWGSEATR
jgi:hypothetical protein